MSDLGTVNNYIQLGLWVVGGITWITKMIRDGKLELKPFGHLGNRVIGYALLAGLILSSLSLYYNISPRVVTQMVQVPAPQPANIIKGWGDPMGHNCQVRLDPLPLLKYQDLYEIAALCGFSDASVDKFSDTRITVTPLYTIASSDDLAIAIPYSKAMTDVIEKMKLESRRRFGPGSQVALSSWIEPVLLPKGTNESDIRKLSDVPRYGGKILSEGF